MKNLNIALLQILPKKPSTVICKRGRNIAEGPSRWGRSGAVSRDVEQRLSDSGGYGGAIEEIRAYRKREVYGNAYRHPAKYSLLTAETIEEPFVRSDYRK